MSRQPARAAAMAVFGLLLSPLAPSVTDGQAGVAWVAARAQGAAAKPAEAEKINTVRYSYEKWSRSGQAQYVLVPKPLELPAAGFADRVREQFKALLGDKRSTYGDARISFPDDVETSHVVYLYLDVAKAQYNPIVMAESVYTFTENGAARVIFPNVQAQGWTRADVPFPAYVLTIDLWQALPPADFTGSLVRAPGGAVFTAEDARKRLEAGEAPVVDAMWSYVQSGPDNAALAAVNAAPLLKLKDLEARLLPVLGSANTALRKAALLGLDGVDSKTANAALRKVMESDAEPALRDQAAALLSKSKDPAFAVAAQFHALKSSDPAVAATAATALGDSKEKEAGEVLKKTVGHADATVRAAAIASLVKRNDLKLLESCLADAALSAEIKAQAAAALAESKDANASHAGLAWLATEGKGDAAAEAATALGKLDRKETYPVLGKALKHPEGAVRRAAALALVELGQSAGLAQLAAADGNDAESGDTVETSLRALYGKQPWDYVLKGTKSDDASLRRAAVATLGAILKTKDGQKNRRAIVETLDKLRTADDALVRAAAARSYGDIGGKDVADNLKTLSQDPAVEVQRAAAAALVAFPGDDTQATLLGYTSKDDPQLKANALRSLGALKIRAGLDPSVQNLKHDDARVRRAATLALGQIGETLEPEKRKPMLSYFSEQVFDKDAQVRLAAVSGLSLLKDPRTVTAMASLLQDPDVEVRIATLKAVGETRDATAVEALGTGLDDDRPSVRKAAAQALQALANKGGVAPLEKLIEREKDAGVLEAAKTALIALKAL